MGTSLEWGEEEPATCMYEEACGSFKASDEIGEPLMTLLTTPKRMTTSTRTTGGSKETGKTVRAERGFPPSRLEERGGGAFTRAT